MDEELINSLSVIGLSQYEARAYCALLGDYPVNAYELAKRCRIPSSKIYETLQRLQSKGCVLVYQSEPIRYAPVPVADVVSRVRLRLGRALDDIELALKHVRKPSEAGLTWSLDGTTNLLEHIETTIARAHRRIFAAMWDPELTRLAAAFRAASARGVELQVAVYGRFQLDVKHTYDLTVCGNSAEERLGGRRLSAVVIDNSETIVTEFGQGSNAQGIWTKNPIVSLLATEYIREEIMGRVLISELGESRYESLRSSRPELIRMLRQEAFSMTLAASSAAKGSPAASKPRAHRSRSASRGA